MMDIIGLVAGILGGLLIGLYVLKQRQFSEKAEIERAEKKVEMAQAEKKELLERAKTKALDQKKQFEFEEKEFTSQLDSMAKILDTKGTHVQKRETKVHEMQQHVMAEEASVQILKQDAQNLGKQLNEQLFTITGLNADAVRTELVKQYEQDFTHEAELRLQRELEWAQECAVRDARNILGEAIYRYSDGACREPSVTRITVTRDEVKGRIVGRGGRLIAFFEQLFDVDVVFNDEPNIIMVSCFNLVNEEKARLALERLMRERVINEEVILRVKQLAEQDMDRVLIQEGNNILKRLQLPNMKPELAKLVGRLKYRTSYGQNVLRHCLEVGYFAKVIAAEVGADQRIAFLAGFFHDIGKSIDQEVGGAHDHLTKEILEKYEFSWEITHAAWTHHNAIPQETIEAKIVQAGDAISAGRPGARAESLDRYVARIHELQDMAMSFPGVKKAYAINAGREVRAIVEPERLRDVDMEPLAKGIAQKVQEKGGYPGRIKIIAIRTTRSASTAKGTKAPN